MSESRVRLGLQNQKLSIMQTAMENMTQHNYMTLEDQAEFLAMNWMSVGQLEKAGELNHLVFRGNDA